MGEEVEVVEVAEEEEEEMELEVVDEKKEDETSWNKLP